MNEITFELKDEFIELIRLLKATRIAQSGAEAKIFVEEGLVQLNGQPESRKRAKIRPGDIVTVDGNTIMVKQGNQDSNESAG